MSPPGPLTLTPVYASAVTYYYNTAIRYFRYNFINFRMIIVKSNTIISQTIKLKEQFD